MKRRTLVAMLLVASLLIGAVSAAAGDLYAGDHLSMQMMVWNSTDTYVAMNEKLLTQFPEMAQKLDIEVIVGGNGDAGVAQKLRLLLASGEKMPDFVRLNYTQFEEFASAGLLYDFSDAIAPYKDDIIPSVLELMTYKDGGIYCLPQEVKPKVWYYRKDIFDAAGVDPTQVKTVADYIDAARKVHEMFPDKYIENYLPPENAYDLTMLLSGNGGRFTDDNGDFVIASDENVKLAFETLKSYNDSGYFAPISEWSADWQAGFTSETLVSQLIGSWMKQHLIAWCPDQAGLWACALWPEEIRAGSESGMGIWVVMKDSENPELAADILAKYSFDPDFRKEIYAYNGIIPPLQSVLSDPVYLAPHPFFGETLVPVTFEALDYLQVYPYTPTFSAEQTIVMQYLNEYIAGNITVEEALQSAQDDMINQIGNAFDSN